MRRVQAFTLAALAFAGSGAGEAGGLAPRSSFSARSGEIVVPAFVNGSGPFLFLLDTGASHSAVSEELAGAVGAPAVARTKVMSTIGHDLRPVVRLDRLNVGPVTASGVLASVVRRDDIDPQGRIQGLIGQDVLASRRYTLDYRQRQVEWLTDADGQAMGGVKLRLHIDEGRSLVELPQDGSILRLVPDSAADGLVLFVRGSQVPLAVMFEPGYAELATLTLRRDVRRVRVIEFRIGTASLRDVPAVLVVPAEGGPEGDGLLPLHFFDRVTFDGPERLLIVEGGPAGLNTSREFRRREQEVGSSGGGNRRSGVQELYQDAEKRILNGK